MKPTRRDTIDVDVKWYSKKGIWLSLTPPIWRRVVYWWNYSVNSLGHSRCWNVMETLHMNSSYPKIGANTRYSTSAYWSRGGQDNSKKSHRRESALTCQHWSRLGQNIVKQIKSYAGIIGNSKKTSSFNSSSHLKIGRLTRVNGFMPSNLLILRNY